MQSPPAEWSLAIAHLGALDYLRSRGDADHDTLSECVRDLVERLPHGEKLLAVGIAAGGLGFWWHIVKPLRL